MLIVDDHPTFRRFARKLLEREGFTVVGEAGDCASALTAVAALVPDVVLLDVMLPDGTGVEVAAELAARKVPSTVVLTSSRSAEDIGVAALAGATGFLAKSDFNGQTFSSLLEHRGVA